MGLDNVGEGSSRFRVGMEPPTTPSEEQPSLGTTIMTPSSQKAVRRGDGEEALLWNKHRHGGETPSFPSFIIGFEWVTSMGEGVTIMFSGTSVRKGWPLARKFDPSRVMDKGKLPLTRPNEFSSTVLLMLGAMGLNSRILKERGLVLRFAMVWFCWVGCGDMVGLYREGEFIFV